MGEGGVTGVFYLENSFGRNKKGKGGGKKNNGIASGN